MKKTFIFFVCFFVIPIFCLATPLFTDESCDCCNVQIGQCANSQTIVSTNKFEETNQVLEDEPEQEENNEKREPSFWKRINPIEGPIYIIGSPFLGPLSVYVGGLFGKQSEWELLPEMPLATIGYLTIGILDTLTIGIFDKEEEVLNFIDFYY